MPVEPKFRYRQSVATQERHGQERVIAIRRKPRRKLVMACAVIVLLVPAALLALQSTWVALRDGVPAAELGSAPAAAPPPRLDPTDPFDRTGAQRLRDPAAGIVLPTATQVGTWQPAEVATVLAGTRTILIAGRTDPAVLAGRPQAYLNLLAPNTRKATAAHLARGPEALGYITRMASGYQVLPAVRAAGSLTVRAGRLGQLIVTSEVSWVYPLAGPLSKDATGAGTRLVVLHSVETYEWFPTKNFAPGDRGARPGDGERKVFNADCGQYAQGLLGLRATGSLKDPYKGHESLFAPATSLDAFAGSC